MTKKNIFLLFLVLVVCFLIAFLFVNSFNKSNKNDKISIATSFYPLYFFTTQVVGDKANVFSIVPAGYEPHDYEISLQDIYKIKNSRMLVVNGLGLESWLDDIKKNINQNDTTILDMSLGLKVQNNNSTDPHFWLSFNMAKSMVDMILQNLIKIDPTNKDYYQKNASNLVENIDKLSQEYLDGLKDCKNKNIVTSHMAFSYLFLDPVINNLYINQISIAGTLNESEASLKQLSEIVNFVKENKIEYIFAEPLLSSKLSDAVAKETNTQVLVLDPIEGIPQNQVSLGQNYFTKMRENLINLKIALQCQ